MKSNCFRLAALATAVAASSTASAQVLDMDISIIAAGVNNYGVANGIRAYSFSTTSCNIGDTVLEWDDSINKAPVIAQNMFWLNDGRLEQLGYSFLKEGFCAVNENSCGSCQSTNCDTLGIGCADTYGAGLNDGRNGVTKSLINANTGVKPNNLTGPSGGPAAIRGRLQVPEAALDTPGALFFFESQYVTTDDQLAGNHRNNVSWRRVNISGASNNASGVGATMRGNPAIYAWTANDPEATITEFTNMDEGGAGVHGFYFVGYTAKDLGNGLWRYEYAVQNTTSDAGANSFELELPCGVGTLTDIYFKDVDPHSGDAYDATDWTFSQTASSLRWEGGDFSANPNGNAIRWGELYNFGFTTDAAPTTGEGRLGLFEGGGQLIETITVPGSSVELYCAANDNSTGSPASILPNVSVSIAANDVNMTVTQLPISSLGYFLMAQGQQQVPLSFSEGNLCVGGGSNTIYRFSGNVLNSGFFGFVDFSADLTDLPSNAMIQAGETWNFQYWFRDANPTSTSNTSNAVSVSFCD